MNIPRILLAAGASGSGKTLITCGMLQALVNRGKKVASLKCGPDYIDPMFHSQVIGTQSANLDTFFTSKEVTRYLLAKNSEDCEIAVMEGVMGFYDGVAGTTTKASAYDLASVTDTPVILIVNSKGMSLSLSAYIKGFLEYRPDSHIAGVILNQMSPMLYPRMKMLLEQELGISVLGYVPKVEDCVIESRHLGLVMPEEIPQLKEKLNRLADILEETLDLEAILRLAATAGEMVPTTEEKLSVSILEKVNNVFGYHCQETVRIGVAEDEAFCFFYKDNLRLLKEMGAELISFSPIYDTQLPENLDGLLLYGGYPELSGRKLENNVSMRTEIKTAIENGMPCMAECGGFMYLHQEMEDMDGNLCQGIGVIEGRAYRTEKLSRFGYITLKQKPVYLPEEKKTDEVNGMEDGRVGEDDEKCLTSGYGEIPAHEFHYFDSTNCGNDFHAAKPESNRGWDCIHRKGRLMAGFPHLYYYGNPKVPKLFLEHCLEYKREREK